MFGTDYNVMICATKKIAESKIKKFNEKYHTWYKRKKYLYENEFLSEAYMDFFYNNPQPDRYRIEKFKVLTK